jgi:hypothetical protein
MIDPKYKAQADLLLQTIPYVAKETILSLLRKVFFATKAQRHEVDPR